MYDGIQHEEGDDDWIDIELLTSDVDFDIKFLNLI